MVILNVSMRAIMSLQEIMLEERERAQLRQISFDIIYYLTAAASLLCVNAAPPYTHIQYTDRSVRFSDPVSV